MNRKAYFQTYLLIRKILQVHIKKLYSKRVQQHPCHQPLCFIFHGVPLVLAFSSLWPKQPQFGQSPAITQLLKWLGRQGDARCARAECLCALSWHSKLFGTAARRWGPLQTCWRKEDRANNVCRSLPFFTSCPSPHKAQSSTSRNSLYCSPACFITQQGSL